MRIYKLEIEEIPPTLFFKQTQPHRHTHTPMSRLIHQHCDKKATSGRPSTRRDIAAHSQRGAGTETQTSPDLAVLMFSGRLLHR